jgi:AmpD protein
VGIELEGTDDLPFTDAQYQALITLTRQLQTAFRPSPAQRICGHSDIAPGARPIRPGFDWARYRAALAQEEGQ